MTKLQRLRRVAKTDCERLGHKMGRFRKHKDGHSAGATCKVCGAWVGVDTKPAPNDIEVGGSAVALHCPQ